MEVVDEVGRLKGWRDTSITYFHELAVAGERILLSVRYGDWTNTNSTEEQAKSWAKCWKHEVQSYIDAYRAVTGVDLSAKGS